MHAKPHHYRRDQDHQESAAYSLQTLRSESQRLGSEVEKLSAENKEVSRQLTLQQSATRMARAASQAAERKARTLREELAKVKTTLVQVRTLCANDVRKRDNQIERLKSHLSGQQRGSNKGIVGATCVITPASAIKISGSGSSRAEPSPLSVEDAEYSLKQESTEFLTHLSQGLSDENDALIGLIRSSLSTLKELLGTSHTDALKSDSRTQSSVQSVDEDGLVRVLPTNYESLSRDLGMILKQLRELLTNPSFAPIEEVHVRDEEILSLREGWDEMAARWKEAVELLQGWVTRLQGGGRTINIEELRMGLGLGEGLIKINPNALTNTVRLESSQSRRSSETNAAGLDHSEISAEEEIVDASIQESVDEHHSLLASPQSQASTSPMSSPVQRSATKRSKHPVSNLHARQVSFEKEDPASNTMKSGRTGTLCARTGSSKSQLPQASRPGAAARVVLSPRSGNTMRAKPVSIPSTTEETILNKQRTIDPSTFRAAKSSPRPFPPNAEEASQLTVPQKLEFAASEARRVSGGSVPESAAPPMIQDVNESDISFENNPAEVQEQPVRTSPAKQAGVSGRPVRAKRRRKSTLTPAELQQLMGCR